MDEPSESENSEHDIAPAVPWRGRDAFYVTLVWGALLLFFASRIEEAALEPGFLLFLYVLLALVTLFWSRLYRSSGLLFGRRFGLRVAPMLVGVGLGVGSLVLSLIFASIVLALSGWDVSGGAGPLVPGHGLSGFVIVLVVVAAPLIEEVFFRGLLQQGLQRSFGGGVAIFVTSVFFGFAHFAGPEVASLISIGTGILVGLVLGWAFLRWQNLAITIVAHATQNALALLLVLAGT